MASHELDADTRRLISLRHEGVPWSQCAEQLGKPEGLLRRRARYLRDTDRWLLPSGAKAKGAPVRGKLGRPRNESPTVSVSPRLYDEAADILRQIAKEEEQRLGLLVALAIDRAIQRASGRRPRIPFDRVRADDIILVDNAAHTATVSVNVPREACEALAGLMPARSQNGAVAAAIYRLLSDLGYTFVPQA